MAIPVHMKKIMFTGLGLACTCATAPAAAEVIKIAMIDALTGTFAALGERQLHTFQMLMANANQAELPGPHFKLEVTGFDGKASPQESLTQLKTAIDQGYRYVAQGGGSGVAFALVDAINKHNARNPGKELVFLNYQSIDPELTNEKCSFWHFRFDPNTDMKMEAMSAAIARDPKIKKVYIVSQDYAHGRQFSKAARLQLARKRPDIEIVGDDFHQIGTVKDFSPYVAKIKASGADTVLTGNWGNDLAFLVRAAKEASLGATFYTFYASTAGVPTVIGAPGSETVKLVASWIPNNETFSGRAIAEQFARTYNDDFNITAIYNVVEMLAKAVKKAGDANPVKVAAALENIEITGLNGVVKMRAADHQAQQPQYVATWAKANGQNVRYEQEKTGYGWRMDQKIDTAVGALPTTCAMQRPAQDLAEAR
jgi:branched-chain amino acid transport system substrate-binding protein